MNIEYLSRAQKIVEEYITRIGSDRTNDSIAPVLDGVMDSEIYANSKLKIAWVLKEPYDDFDENGAPYGGGWKMRDIYFKTENVYENIKQNPTLNTMAYTTYGLLNNELYEEMPWIYEDYSVGNSLRSIVHMNISKFPGNTTTPWNKLYSDYEFWRPILLFQLLVYKPQIVIFGNVMDLFSSDLNLTDIIQYDKEKNLGFALKDGCLYINAYHPAQRIIKKQVYINDIIQLVREHSPISNIKKDKSHCEIEKGIENSLKN